MIPTANAILSDKIYCLANDINAVEVSSETKNQMNTSELKQRRLLKDG
jgi:uncharacterized protein YdcH (DUF465 family)